MTKNNYIVIGVVFVVALAIGLFLGFGVKMMNGGLSGKHVEESQQPLSGNGGRSQSVDLNETVRFYQDKLKTDPKNYEALVGLGDAYFELQKFKLSIDYYNRAVEVNPEDAATYNDLGLAYHYMGKSDVGLEYVEKGLKINPLQQRIWLTKGFILATTGKVSEAIKAWEKSYGLGPETDVGQAAKSFLDQYRPLSSLEKEKK